MDWLWTWGGISFGYKVDDRVFTHFGLQIGRVDGEEVYASDGRYLGEIMSDNRLIIHRGKKNYRHSGFSPREAAPMPGMRIMPGLQCTLGMRISLHLMHSNNEQYRNYPWKHKRRMNRSERRAVTTGETT